TGTAELKIAHIEWALSPIVQVADGESEINWEVKLVNDYGELVDMEVTFTLSAVNVSPAADWTISPESGPGPDLWGTVVSADSSKGQLKVAYNYFGEAKDSVSDPMWFVQVDRLQYRFSATNAWADMPDPLYVCKDKTVDFKAIKKPDTAPSWPSGKPVWTGASGAGDYASQTFTTPGTNLVTAECGNTVTGKVVAISVEFVHLSTAPRDGISETRFYIEEGVPIASGPAEMNGLVRVTPEDQVDKVVLRLAHNVKTLRQRAVPSSTTNMFQMSTDGAWVKDNDSTKSITLLGAGEMRIRGEDEPMHGYWRDGPFSHPLHIVENHKNFLQYQLLSCDWKTLGVVEWGWTADVYKDGETITTSGTIEGEMGHESNETPITLPHIQDIPETSIPPID
ncbi:MAG: hypothetical protein KKE37_11135, partial [Verrucomicrobia bacterium]|nr:hypothetical protein [Verrucomicrobiota bacterium]